MATHIRRFAYHIVFFTAPQLLSIHILQGSPRPKPDGSSSFFNATAAPASIRTYRQGTPPRRPGNSSNSTSSSRNANASKTAPVRMLSSATIQRLSTPRRQNQPTSDPTVPKPRPASPMVIPTSSSRSRPSSPFNGSIRGSTPTRSRNVGQWK